MGQQQAEGQQQDGGELTRVGEARPARGVSYLGLVGAALALAAVGRIAVASRRVNCGAGSRTGRAGLGRWRPKAALWGQPGRGVHRCTVRCTGATPTVGGGLWLRTHAHAAQVGAGQRVMGKMEGGTLQGRRDVSAVVYVSLVCSARCGHSPDDVWGPHPSARQTSF